MCVNVQTVPIVVNPFSRFPLVWRVAHNPIIISTVIVPKFDSMNLVAHSKLHFAVFNESWRQRDLEWEGVRESGVETIYVLTNDIAISWPAVRCVSYGYSFLES